MIYGSVRRKVCSEYARVVLSAEKYTPDLSQTPHLSESDGREERKEEQSNNEMK